MDNQTLLFILKMRDEASQVFNAATENMKARGQSFADSVKKNWLAISAGAIATIALINRAWKYAEMAAANEQAERAFTSVMKRMGLNAQEEFDKINKAAAGIMNESDLQQAIQRGLTMGIPIKEMNELMVIARAKARDMGITVSDAYSGIIEGVGRVNPRMLQSVGIIVKQKEVTAELVEANGKLEGGFSTVATRAEVLNQVLTQGREAVGRYNLSALDTSEKMQKIRASITELREAVGVIVIRIGTGLVGMYNLVSKVFAEIYGAILKPFAAAEAIMNKLGISSDRYFQNLYISSKKLSTEYGKEMKEAFDAMFASSKDLTTAMGGMSEVQEETANTAKPVAGTINELKERANSLQEAMDKLNLKTKAGFSTWVGLARNLKEVNNEIAIYKKMQEILMEGKEGLGIKAGIKLPKAEVNIFKKELKVLENTIKSDYDFGIIDPDKFKANVDIVLQTMNLLSGFTSQASQIRLENIQAEKEAMLGAIDAELVGQNISEARRSELLKQRAAMEASFNQRMRAEKENAFNAQKQASIIESIINTAVAATKVVGQMGIFGIPMVPIVVALGAAQTALIASQPVPRFHSGGVGYFDAPPSSEANVRIRGGETIRVTTHEQEKKKTGGFTLIMNSPNFASKEAFKNIVQGAMREMGVTNVNDYFVNNRNIIRI